jgi:hypothetical protein
VNAPVMPRSAWNGTSQTYVYWPAGSATVYVSVAPGPMIVPALTPLIEKLCVSWPLFVIMNVTCPEGTLCVESSKRYSNMPTWTVEATLPTVPVDVVVVGVVVVVVVVVVGTGGLLTFTPTPNLPFMPSWACPRIVQRYAILPFFLNLTGQGRTTTRWRVAIPRAHSARDAAAMLARAGHVWRSLRSVSFTEALASDARPPLRSTWQLQAPDRVAYQVHGGWSAVIIGGRRWDRSPGAAKWVESQQTRLTQPVPSWGAVTDAYLLGRTTARGRPAWKLSFFDPRTPAWFTVTLDAKTLHTLDVWMIATAHFMHDSYSGFDSTASIVAPS